MLGQALEPASALPVTINLTDATVTTKATEKQVVLLINTNQCDYSCVIAIFLVHDELHTKGQTQPSITGFDVIFALFLLLLLHKTC